MSPAIALPMIAFFTFVAGGLSLMIGAASLARRLIGAGLFLAFAAALFRGVLA
jgi:hypothetical protein